MNSARTSDNLVTCPACLQPLVPVKNSDGSAACAACEVRLNVASVRHWYQRAPRALRVAGTLICVAGLAVPAYFGLQAERRAESLASELAEVRVVAKDAAQIRKEAHEKSRLALQAIEAYVEKLKGVGPLGLADAQSSEETHLAFAMPFLEHVATQPPTHPHAAHEAAQASVLLAIVHEARDERPQALSTCAHARDLLLNDKWGVEPPIEHQATLASCFELHARLLRTDDKPAEAEASQVQAIAIRHKLVEGDRKDARKLNALAQSLNDWGSLLTELDRLPEAEAALGQALAIRGQLVAEHPDDLDFVRQEAESLVNLGAVQRAQGRPTQAGGRLVNATAILENLANGPTATPEHRRSLARAHEQMAMVLRDMSELKGAEASYFKALLIRENLLGKNPGTPRLQQELANSQNNFGVFLHSIGKREDARRAFQRGSVLLARLAEKHPEVAKYRAALGGSYVNLANLAAEDGKLEEAVESYARGIVTLKQLSEKALSGCSADQFLRNGHIGRAHALNKLGRHETALGDWDAALQLDPENALSIKLGRAATLAQLGRHRDAMADLQVVAASREIPAATLYDAACVSAAVYDSAKDQSKEVYATHTIEFLNRATTAGYFTDSSKIEKLQKNQSFDSLRSREEFKSVTDVLERQRRSLPRHKR